VRNLWGCWVIAVSGSSRSAQGRLGWKWRVRNTLGKPFLHGLGPWLRIKKPQCDNALAMVELLKRSYRTLGPYPIPAEWLAEQEQLYWVQRELNHRGTAVFVKKPMHSPRQINRVRALARIADASNNRRVRTEIIASLPTHILSTPPHIITITHPYPHLPALLP